MFDEFQEWVSSQIPDYQAVSGQWVDHDSLGDSFLAATSALGGPMPTVDVRNGRFGLILLGRRGKRGDYSRLMDDANALVEMTLQDGPGRYRPCGAANITVSRLPVGPAYTNENRPYVMLDFTVTW